MLLGSILDKKAGCYIQDCVYADRREVFRNLSAIVNDNDPKNIFARYPMDFRFDLHGEFESMTYLPAKEAPLTFEFEDFIRGEH